MPDSFYDVVILGAGPAGLSTAITLGNLTRLKILVADAGQLGRIRPGESIPPDTLLLIRSLKVMQSFQQDGHCAYPGHVSVWGQAEIGYNDALVDPMGLPWRLHRPRFDRMLATAAESEFVRITWGLKYISQTETGSDNGFSLRFWEPTSKKIVTIHTNYVVDATGPLARFGQSMGSNRIIDDRMVALVYTQDILDGSMPSQTLIESVPSGWWYAAKLPEGKLITMFITEVQTLRQMYPDLLANFKLAISETTLLANSTASISLRPGLFHTTPVYSSYLDKAYGDNWLAVGDAASCYDPIAAQGIFKSISTGIQAGKLIAYLARTNYTTDETLVTYNDKIQADYQTYFRNRDYLYRLEQRWRGSLFWQNRIRAGNLVS